MQARPAGDFALGMRFLPVLDGPPPARVLVADRALAERFAPDVVLVVLASDALRLSALDSLSRVLEPLRADSVTIAVALHHGRNPLPADDPERLRDVQNVLERVRPDVLFPAIGDPLPSVLPSASPSISWWRFLLRSTAQVRDRVRPATRLGVVLSRLDARDSAIYAWASSAGSTVSIVGAVVYPSFSGLAGVDARLRAFERWHARATVAGDQADSTTRPMTATHWLVHVGGLPRAHGDASQLAAIRRAFAWGSRQPWITAAIVGEAADYDGGFGIRAANGRVRTAWPTLSASARAMRDVRVR